MDIESLTILATKSLPSEGECLVSENTENDLHISLGPSQTVEIESLLVSFESIFA